MKAIETRYKGYRFRSRLEARWAVFFDSLGLRWQYELEGFKIADGLFWYLPDFYLPDWDLFLEIKPDMPKVSEHDGVFYFGATDGEQITAIGKFLFAASDMQIIDKEKKHIHQRLMMACGVPGHPDVFDYKGRWKLRDGSIVLNLQHGNLITIEAFSDNQSENDLGIWPLYANGNPPMSECAESWNGQGLVFPSGMMTRLYVGNGRHYASKRLMTAYRAARSARFEHGECG